MSSLVDRLIDDEAFKDVEIFQRDPRPSIGVRHPSVALHSLVLQTSNCRRIQSMIPAGPLNIPRRVQLTTATILSQRQLELFVYFLYFDLLPENEPFDDILQLLRVAAELDWSSLSLSCQKILAKCVSAQNIASLLPLVIWHNLPLLKSALIGFLESPFLYSNFPGHGFSREFVEFVVRETREKPTNFLPWLVTWLKNRGMSLTEYAETNGLLFRNGDILECLASGVVDGEEAVQMFQYCKSSKKRDYECETISTDETATEVATSCASTEIGILSPVSTSSPILRPFKGASSSTLPRISKKTPSRLSRSSKSASSAMPRVSMATASTITESLSSCVSSIDERSRSPDSLTGSLPSTESAVVWKIDTDCPEQSRPVNSNNSSCKKNDSKGDCIILKALEGNSTLRVFVKKLEGITGPIVIKAKADETNDDTNEKIGKRSCDPIGSFPALSPGSYGSSGSAKSVVLTFVEGTSPPESTPSELSSDSIPSSFVRRGTRSLPRPKINPIIPCDLDQSLALSNPDETIRKSVRKRKADDYVKTWDEYLLENDVRAAPVEAFKQPVDPSKNWFKIGTHLLVRATPEELNRDLFNLAVVDDVKGYRIKVKLCFTDGMTKENSFWRTIDCDSLRHLDLSTSNVDFIAVPPSSSFNPVQFHRRLSQRLATLKRDRHLVARAEWFAKSPSSPPRNLFRVGDKLEAVDLKNPHLLCPATIKESEEDGNRVKVGFDGYSSTYDYVCSFKDRNIFPIKWHLKTRDSLECAGPLL